MNVPEADLYRTVNTYWSHHGWLMAKLRHFLPLEVLQDINVFVLRIYIVARDSFVWNLSPFGSFLVKDVYVVASSSWDVASDKIWSKI